MRLRAQVADSSFRSKPIENTPKAQLFSSRALKHLCHLVEILFRKTKGGIVNKKTDEPQHDHRFPGGLLDVGGNLLVHHLFYLSLFWHHFEILIGKASC